MTSAAQMSFFDDEPQPEKKKTQPFNTSLPKVNHNPRLTRGVLKDIMLAKVKGEALGSLDDILDKASGDASPFLSSGSGEFEEQFEHDEHVSKARQSKPKHEPKEAYVEGLEEPLPFKPKREYSRYVVTVPPTEDFLVYQWQVRTLPNDALVKWMQTNPDRIGNPVRWAAVYDLLKKMAYREAPWEMLERIEEEIGLNKRDLLDALIAADAMGVIKGEGSAY